jgi:hypothetical protein
MLVFVLASVLSVTGAGDSPSKRPAARGARRAALTGRRAGLGTVTKGWGNIHPLSLEEGCYG